MDRQEKKKTEGSSENGSENGSPDNSDVEDKVGEEFEENFHFRVDLLKFVPLTRARNGRSAGSSELNLPLAFTQII